MENASVIVGEGGAMFYRLRKLFRATGRDLIVLWYACRNRHTPGAIKLAAILLCVYVFSPIDLIPDTLPVIGWVDDVTLLALAIPALLRMAPANSLQEANTAADRLLSRWAFWRNG
jgi:uncharacterized membrane protein YkvA (DUF1232 family)